MLSFPNEHLPRLLNSPTLDLAVRASLLAFVNASNILHYAKVRATTLGVWGCSNKWFCINKFANMVPREAVERHLDSGHLGDKLLRIGSALLGPHYGGHPSP